MEVATPHYSIRRATVHDLDTIIDIMAYARNFMSSHGNPMQWVDGYPSRALMAEEIARGACRVCVDANKHVAGTFCYHSGPDPSYATIYEGKWLDEDAYGVIHRLAAAKGCRGVGAACLTWAFAQCPNLRVDTHADNVVMQRLLGKHGFICCGRIKTRNGTWRLAYQCHRAAKRSGSEQRV